jgi:hypothetical protein
MFKLLIKSFYDPKKTAHNKGFTAMWADEPAMGSVSLSAFVPADGTVFSFSCNCIFILSI